MVRAAEAKPAEKPKGNRPQYVARTRQAPDSEYWTNIGVAWDGKDGMISVKLHVIPLNWTGDFLLMHPREEGDGDER